MVTLIGLLFAFLLSVFGFITIKQGGDEIGILELIVAALILGLTLGRLLPF